MYNHASGVKQHLIYCLPGLSLSASLLRQATVRDFMQLVSSKRHWKLFRIIVKLVDKLFFIKCLQHINENVLFRLSMYCYNIHFLTGTVSF